MIWGANNPSPQLFNRFREAIGVRQRYQERTPVDPANSHPAEEGPACEIDQRKHGDLMIARCACLRTNFDLNTESAEQLHRFPMALNAPAIHEILGGSVQRGGGHILQVLNSTIPHKRIPPVCLRRDLSLRD